MVESPYHIFRITNNNILKRRIKMNNQKINSMSYENRVKQLTNGILLASGLYDKNFNLITNKITRASMGVS